MRRSLPPRLITFGLLAPAGVAFAAGRAFGAPGGGTDDYGGGGGSSSGGGGSSYSDSGSSGGGSYSGGGSSRRTSGSGSSSGSSDAGGGVIILLVIVLIVAIYYGVAYYNKQRTAALGPTFDSGPSRSRVRKVGASRSKRQAREQQVAVAAEEALQEDPAFAPEAVKAAALELHRQVTEAWGAGDRDALAKLISGPLHVEWCRRLDDFDRKGWTNVTKILEPPSVEYLGLANKEGTDDDSVTVRIEASLLDYVMDKNGQAVNRKDEASKRTVLAEYWTLARTGGGWMLVSTEQDAEGAHFISDPIVSSPLADDTAIRDEAVTEQAVARAIPDAEVSGVADVDFEGSARTAALDMASQDGRFEPDVLEAAARRAVAGWTEAIDGPDEALAAVASPEAVKALLYPSTAGEGYRVVVRGAKLDEVRITKVDAAAKPATMTLQVKVTGARYLQNRDTTAVVEGDRDKATTFTEHWVMALDGADATPWRLVGAQA